MGMHRQGRRIGGRGLVIVGVAVDSPLPHLDRPFDYEVPDSVTGVTMGTRVRVPFAGRLVSGVVTSVDGRRGAHPLKSVRSAGAIPSFTPAALDLARSIAARYAGSLWDVLRLMGPPRVAAVEKYDWNAWARTDVDSGALGALTASAERFALPAVRSDRAVWAATPSRPEVAPTEEILGAAIAASAQGGTSIIVASDSRAVAALLRTAGEHGLKRWTPRSGGHIAVIDSEDGASVRYGSHIAAMRGLVPLVIGTRHAAWQPVPDLASITVWDEASSTLAEPRAPYPHARTVCAMRSQDSGAALLVAGHALSAEAVALVGHGFARRIEARPERSALPAVEVVGAERREREGGAGRHWMPGHVWAPLIAAARTGLAAVVVPQGGYAAGLACVRCGTWAECADCGGDLSRASANDGASCTDCGAEAPAWHCPECREHRMRPVGLGADRLAEQLGRMAAGVPVTQSSATVGVLDDLAVDSGIVVATPGALPAVKGGYGYVAIVGAKVSVNEGLGAEVQALRRWLNAAALVAARADGGGVAVVGDLPGDVRQALVAWDGWDVAYKDLQQRETLGLPPHRRALRLDGPSDAIDEAVGAFDGAEATVSRDLQGAWVMSSRGAMQGIVTAVRAVAVARSLRSADALYVKVDATPSG